MAEKCPEFDELIRKQDIVIVEAARKIMQEEAATGRPTLWDKVSIKRKE